MTLVTNSFDGITPSGTTISAANSGGTSGDAFDSVTGTPASDNTNIHGGSGLAMMVSSTAATQFVVWNASTFTSVPGALYWRAYLYMASAPGSIVQLFTARTASATASFMQLNTSGALVLKNFASTTLWTSSALATSTWHRIECLVLGGTTGSDGQLQALVFSGANSEGSTADQDSTLFTGANAGTTGTCNVLRLGSATAVTVTFWLDDVGASTTGYLGPAGGGPASPNAALAASTGVPPAPAASVSLGMTIQGV